MSKKITREEFENRIKKVSNDTIDVSQFNFVKTSEKGLCKCKICGYEWRPFAYSILQGHGCRKCYDRKNALSKLYDIKHVQNKIDEIGSNCTIIGEYIDTKHKCKAECNKCGYMWRPFVRDLLNGHGCPICGLKKQGLSERLCPNEYKSRCFEMYGNAYDLSELNYTTMRNSVYPICPKHGKLEMSAYQFLDGSGCQKCRASKLENEVRAILTQQQYSFIEQKHFNWLGLQSLDFYLPQYNIAIECQGKQHFEPIICFGGVKNFTEQKERDKRKLHLCNENRIKLLYYANYEYEFPYDVITDKNKLIDIIKQYATANTKEN